MRESSRVLLWMCVFLVVVVAVCALLFDPLRQAFIANQIFNSMILGVLLVGITINFRQVSTLGPASVWIESFREESSKLSVESRPRLLAPMAKLLSSIHQTGFRVSALTVRSMLEAIRMRLDESRDLSRYMIGLLVFLGLLGTFWGLLDTVRSVGGVISGLSLGEDVAATFEGLKSDLKAPLSGMGTAFSSSLFGLGGALVLGFLDLQAGHAQNRFYNQLEEWLSELIHLPSGGGLTVEGEQSLPRYVEALLEQTADNLDKLQRAMARGEDDRRVGQNTLREFAERLAELSDQMRGDQKLVAGLTQSQAEMRPALERLASGWGSDEVTREHLRSLDTGLARLAEELSLGRRELAEELRSELRLLTRTVAQAADANRRVD